MSIVTIQVGQCGNQLGSSLFNALHHHSCDPILTADSTKPGDRKSGAQSGSRTDDDASAEASACRRSFFRNKGTVARAVVVDTEPKVIQQIIARGVIGLRASQGDGTQTRSAKSRGEESGVGGSHWSYDSGTQVCCHAQGGAANNWAYGYHRYGARFTEACLEGVRREAERCDHLAGLCVLHSAAGGTGSGLGTFLTEALRDNLPSAFLLNTVVCAPTSGEVILQNYNTIFTLSKLAQCSDGVLVIDNGGATEVCRKLLRITRPSHSDLNRVIAGSLVGALIPSEGAVGGSGRGCGGGRLHLGDKLAHLCPNKDFMFLRTSMLPQIPDTSRAFTTNTWEALTRRAYQMQVTGNLADLELDWRKKVRFGAGAEVGLNQSVSSLLTFHGGGVDSVVGLAPKADCFRSRDLYAGWSQEPFLECRSSLRLQGHDRALTLVSNSQAVLGVLEKTAEKSRAMYAAGAYVHHFAKAGAETDDFEEAFLRIDQAIQNYRSLG